MGGKESNPHLEPTSTLLLDAKQLLKFIIT